LRRPYRPLQVIGVLAAVLPIARKSLQFSRSAERAGRLPIPAQINRAKPGERLHANTTGGQLSMRANALLSCQRTAIVRIRHVAISERQQLEEVDGFLVRSEMKAWEAIMSSPIHLDDNTDPALIYAPPWARERIIPISEPTSRYRASTTTAIKMGPKKFKPKYSGDRAMLALQRQLALHPNRIPEPSSGSAIAIGPVLMRLCSVTVLAAVVAWGLVSYAAVKKTAEINASAPAIASNHVNVVEVQPLQLRPTLSHEAPAPTGKSRPVAARTADAEAATSVPVLVAPKAAETVVVAPAPSQHANDRRPLRLDSEEIAILVKRGNDFLADGDIAAARLLLRRAAEAGSAEGALALGTTFDPIALKRLGAIGAIADLAQARQWYQCAAELGSSAASQQLAGLADLR
jgi:hypothetical protein